MVACVLQKVRHNTHSGVPIAISFSKIIWDPRKIIVAEIALYRVVLYRGCCVTNHKMQLKVQNVLHPRKGMHEHICYKEVA